MGHLRIKTNESNYKEHNRCLKEQIINGINDKMITVEIKKKNKQQCKTSRMLGSIVSCLCRSSLWGSISFCFRVKGGSIGRVTW